MGKLINLVILDRDGVINHDSDNYIKSPQEWQPLPGSLEAIAKLTRADYKVVVITNQSGLARKLFDVTTLYAIHAKMHQAVEAVGGRIDALLYCPHKPNDNCQCRKPKIYLFEELKTRLGISLQGVPAIGDSLRDLQAAAAAGARPILVRSGKGLRTIEDADPLLQQIPIYNDLAQFVDAHLDAAAG